MCSNCHDQHLTTHTQPHDPDEPINPAADMLAEAAEHQGWSTTLYRDYLEITAPTGGTIRLTHYPATSTSGFIAAALRQMMRYGYQP